MSAIGTILNNRYELVAELGKGGMSTVFLSRDKKLESYWAVKQVSKSANVDIDAFKREAELLSGLAHSDIPRIVDRIEAQDDYFVVMDFIDGVSLSKKVQTEGPQKEKDVIKWAEMICEVLEYLHTAKEHPIIYRDIKPENLMLIQTGRIKLIDFGIAKECIRGRRQSGATIGTRGYAAPEQYKGASNILDERTDIYSLGATLFYLVTGMPPEMPPNGITKIRQINPLLSEGLEYIINKCTRFEPADRYQNISELRNDINDIDKLNSTYKKAMKKDLWMFLSCFFMFVAFGITGLLGLSAYEAEMEDKFQIAYNQALKYERTEAYTEAAACYRKAIGLKPDEYDTYLRLFNAILPRDDECDDAELIKSAIDEMRKNYIENGHSEMYRGIMLISVVAKKCLEVNDPVYASFAAGYYEMIRDSSEYRDGILCNAEIDSYEVLAINMARNITTLDFDAFNTALLNLTAASENLPVNDKLQNLYIIMLMYSTYPSNLPDAHKRISDIGATAKSIIDTNINQEDIAFSSVIPMYEMVASALYSYALTRTDQDSRRAGILNSLEWFSYLEDLNVELDEMLHLKKGNAYKSFFDTYYNFPNERVSISGNVLKYLHSAISVYKEIISINPESFLAHVCLTRAMIDEQLIKPSNQRDFSEVILSYSAVTKMKNQNKNLPSSFLAQFSSLRTHMQTAGLEV